MRYWIMSLLALTLLSGCDKRDQDDENDHQPQAEKPKKEEVKKEEVKKETKTEEKKLAEYKEKIAKLPTGSERSDGKTRFKTVIMDGKEYVVTSRNGPFPTDGQSYILEDSLPKDWEKPAPALGKDCGPVG